MTPYAVPQAWARALSGAGFRTISHRTRFDTGAASRGLAHFGPSGRARRKVDRGRPIGPDLRRRLSEECGVLVVAAPSLAELTLAPGP